MKKSARWALVSLLAISGCATHQPDATNSRSTPGTPSADAQAKAKAEAAAKAQAAARAQAEARAEAAAKADAAAKARAQAAARAQAEADAAAKARAQAAARAQAEARAEATARADAAAKARAQAAARAQAQARAEAAARADAAARARAESEARVEATARAQAAARAQAQAQAQAADRARAETAARVEAAAQAKAEANALSAANQHVSEGKSAENWHDTRRAIAEYQAALAAEPEFQPALFRLGILYTNAKQFDAAIDVWHRYIKATNDSAAAYCNLALTLDQDHRTADAEEAYKSAVARDPKNEPARVNYGLMLARLERFDDAAAQLQAVMTPAEAHYDIAAVLELQGNTNAAQTQYREALRLDPNLKDAQSRLAGLDTGEAY